jgi:hypothetical protein
VNESETCMSATVRRIAFKHHALAAPNQSGREPLPPPGTWDYFDHQAVDAQHRPVYASYLAFATCPKGHVGLICSTVFGIAEDGTLSPSYVCPVASCGFHEFVRFDGWDARFADRESRRVSQGVRRLSDSEAKRLGNCDWEACTKPVVFCRWTEWGDLYVCETHAVTSIHDDEAKAPK